MLSQTLMCAYTVRELYNKRVSCLMLLCSPTTTLVCALAHICMRYGWWWCKRPFWLHFLVICIEKQVFDTSTSTLSWFFETTQIQNNMLTRFFLTHSHDKFSSVSKVFPLELLLWLHCYCYIQVKSTEEWASELPSCLTGSQPSFWIRPPCEREA